MSEATASESPNSLESSWPKLTELEKLLLTDANTGKLDVDKLMRKMSLQPAPPKNYSLVDNIYHHLTTSSADLFQHLHHLQVQYRDKRDKF